MSRKLGVAATAAVALLLTLSGCGSVPAGPGSIGAPTVVGTAGPDDTVSTTVGTDPDPGTPPPPLVAVAPPPVFTARADVVAEAVRRAGLPTPPSGPVLTSGWALDEGFDTDVQKISWSYGHVTFAPGVVTGQTGTGMLRTADGQSRPVDLIGPWDALNRALSNALAAPAPCPFTGAGAPQCGITVTAATVTEAEVGTNQGAVRAPVWRLEIEGLSHSIDVIAVAPGVFDERPEPTPLPGLDPPPVGIYGAMALEPVNGRTLEFTIGHGVCDQDIAAHAVEFKDLVVLGGTYRPDSSDRPCVAMLAIQPATVTLKAPLGDRRVVDAGSGTVLVPGANPW